MLKIELVCRVPRVGGREWSQLRGKSKNVLGMAKALQLVLKHKMLKEILIEAPETGSLKLVLEQELRPTPEAGKIVTLFHGVPVARRDLMQNRRLQDVQPELWDWVKSLDEVVSEHTVV